MDLESSQSELFLDFRKNPLGEAIIKVKDRTKTNPTLKQRLKDTDEDHPNVLNIFVDTVSRDRIWRKYKRMVQVLADIKNNKDIKAEVYEHKMLFSIGGWTMPNKSAWFYGSEAYKGKMKPSSDKKSENYYQNMKATWNYAQDQGYITGFSNDLCDCTGFNRFSKPSYDY
jgi:hypothetical protein